ncbi:hypothetical protein Thpro_020902 [Acidihalobacter prosperus]|uniref:Uncharacterized protein n=1 Tax=Acidihalobacter prosperus TaxID=160660 RepID=A0A1A6C5L2_9GAMM|nr:hypothetical protein Thpro_020902 [Acidihalobacter prosperus]
MRRCRQASGQGGESYHPHGAWRQRDRPTRSSAVLAGYAASAGRAVQDRRGHHHRLGSRGVAVRREYGCLLPEF